MSDATLPTCPQCGRALYFTHPDTTLVPCACGTTVQRIDGAVSLRPVFLVPKPSDLIQPGTEGTWEGKKFWVLGRKRAWIEEFVWNYWTIKWEDDSLGYLGEGYGLYAVYEKTAGDEGLTETVLASLHVGAKRNLFNDEDYILERKYTCHQWEAEGEIWMPGVPPTFRTFEFASVSGGRIEVIAFRKNVVVCFKVRYASLQSLALTTTRSAELPAKTVTCTQCGNENALKASPYSRSFACVQCRTRYVFNELHDAKRWPDGPRSDEGGDIQLGAVATVKGISYQVIGYAQKEERNAYRSKWKEYTLYNGAEGFAFLSEYNGHWTYVRERGDAPVLQPESVRSFEFGAENFELFNKYQYDLINAVGEFPYNAFNDGSKEVKEFISPPEIWIQEADRSEGIVWFLGEHLSAKEVRTAFGDKINLPYKTGVGAAEPKGYVSPAKIGRVAAGAVLMAVLVHVLTSMTHQQRLLFDNNYSFKDAADTVSYVTEPFVLEKGTSNIEFDVSAPVNNGWAEVGATLVDMNRGTEYSFEKGVEYYYGWDGGEKWSEGSQEETAYLSTIPAGTYRLQIRGTKQPGTLVSQSAATGSNTAYAAPTDSFRIKATYDTTNTRNLFLVLIPLVLWPFVHYLIVRANEGRRWSNSPFSPYSDAE